MKRTKRGREERSGEEALFGQEAQVYHTGERRLLSISVATFAALRSKQAEASLGEGNGN